MALSAAYVKFAKLRQSVVDGQTPQKFVYSSGDIAALLAQQW